MLIITANTPLDVIVISGDQPQEVLGKTERERTRLTIDGIPASLPFLRSYYDCGQDVDRALARIRKQGIPFLSLNGVYLRQYLTRSGFITALIPFFRPQRELLRSLLLTRRPRAVVISTTFLPFAEQIDAIAAFVKQHAPETPVIAGGTQIWKSYQHRQLSELGHIGPEIHSAVSEHNYLLDCTRPSPVDILIISAAGERTLVAVLQAIRNGRAADNIDNTAIYHHGRWSIRPITASTPEEVAIDWSEHGNRIPAVYVPVQAGPGCRSQCKFCDFAGLRPLQARSTASLMKEIASIPPLNGVRRVYFTDDNLFPTKQRVREICRAMIEQKLNVQWRGLMRIAIVDEEVADLIAASGALEVLLGIESGDPDMLRRMNKRVRPEQILSGIAKLAERGISTKSTFMIGFPGETAASIDRTVELLNAYPVSKPALHRYLFFLFAVLPLSAIATPAAREREELKGYGYHWTHRTMNSREAAAHVEAVHERIIPQLSPSYVLETPELPGMLPEDIKQLYVIRNQLAKHQRNDTLDSAAASRLWHAMEARFQCKQAVALRPPP